MTIELKDLEDLRNCLVHCKRIKGRSVVDPSQLSKELDRVGKTIGAQMAQMIPDDSFTRTWSSDGRTQIEANVYVMTESQFTFMNSLLVMLLARYKETMH